MNKSYILENVRDFHLKDTFECGQCFHFERTDNGLNKDEYEYDVVAKDRILHIKEEPDSDGVRLTFFNTEEWEYESIWKEYFDLDRDYSEIKDAIISADPRLEDIIYEYSGIRSESRVNDRIICHTAIYPARKGHSHAIYRLRYS